jgi:hypothetical protein
MPRPLVDNGADPEQLRRANRTVTRRDSVLVESIRVVMRTPAGRFVMHTVLDDALVDGTSFHPSGSQMYFNEGKRKLGVEWRDKLIAADEANYELMQREARERARRLDSQLPPAATEEE